MGINAKISVIIPVYKVERFLNRCLESVVNQTYKNIEIILVDDGSPDQCPQMCDAWAEKDSRIKVIHKENEGLGMARNTGMEHATGDYICFFDSDDYVDTQVIEKAVCLANRTEADIVLFGMTLVDVSGEIVCVLPPQTEKQLYVGEEVKNELLPDLMDSSNPSAKAKNLCMSMCTNLFRTDLIRKAKWRVVSEREIISEDYYSMLVLFKDIKKASVLSEPAYYYCHNGSSLSHTYRTDRYEQTKKFYSAALSVISQDNYCHQVGEQIKRVFLGLSIGAMKQIVCSGNDFKTKLQLLSKILWDGTMQDTLRSVDEKNYIRKQKLLFFFVKKKCRICVYVLARLQAEKDRILQG